MNKIIKYINYPLYRKIDCLKDYFYKIKSYLFFSKNKLIVSDGNPREELINLYNKINDNYIFQNSSYFYCKRMIDFVLNKGYAYKSFIDLGSAKGKICFEVESNYNFDSISGVEYDNDLFWISIKNLNNYISNKIIFINEDVKNYKIPSNSSIIFLFNSFNAEILRKFISGNIISLRRHNCILLYRHDSYAYVLEEFDAHLLQKDVHRKDSIWIFK
jgi:hypothetical protein